MRPRTVLALFAVLAAALLTGSGERVPESSGLGIYRGAVNTCTATGALISTEEGLIWVITGCLSEIALRNDSVMVLGRLQGMYLTPISIRHKPSGSVIRYIRSAFRSILFKTVPDPAARGLAGGLLMGLRGTVPQNTALLFRNSGTSHLLALSGLHTAIAAGLVTLLGRLLFGKRPLSSILAAAGVLAFVLLSGSRPSTVRAGIMAICALWWMTMKGGRTDVLSFWWLAVAVSVMLLPDTLRNRGAWMSYGAVLSLILLGKSFSGKAAPLLSPIAAGITVTVGIAPLVHELYGGVSLAGPLATVVSLPLMVLVMLTGTAAAAGFAPASSAVCGISSLWTGILEVMSHEPLRLTTASLWLLWVPSIVLLRVIALWNGFHRRFR